MYVPAQSGFETLTIYTFFQHSLMNNVKFESENISKLPIT